MNSCTQICNQGRDCTCTALACKNPARQADTVRVPPEAGNVMFAGSPTDGMGDLTKQELRVAIFCSMLILLPWLIGVTMVLDFAWNALLYPALLHGMGGA